VNDRAVVDLGFGDAGKGSLVDFLVRDQGADLVVRFNGGAQAGHNVVAPDGRHHTFSQFCAGHLAGARGLLGPDFLLHPLAMAVEAAHLQDPWSRTEVDGRARVITPWHQAAGRIREVLRGAAAHGSCGVGVGERVADGLAHPDDAIFASDLRDPGHVRVRLERQRERKRAELAALGAEDLGLFDDAGLVGRVLAAWRDVGDRLAVLTPDQTRRRIADARVVIFEGAQGVLLDETWGFHPHTTWSDCTFRGAQALAGDRPVTRLGAIRAYMVRHGPGPFPTEEDPPLPEPHNAADGWQGAFRTGPLDLVLLRYAIEVCGGIDGLAITCLDRVDAPRVARSLGGVARLDPGDPADLAHREALGRWLRGAVPALATPPSLLGEAEDRLGVPVVLTSQGARAGDKRWR
jgi:adenylosuccinate synthase